MQFFFILKDFVQYGTVSFIIITEDILSELLNLSYYIPIFIVLYIFLNIGKYPLKQFVFLMKFFNKFVYSILFYLIIIQFHP